jgi:hypothetical protein
MKANNFEKGFSMRNLKAGNSLTSHEGALILILKHYSHYFKFFLFATLDSGNFFANKNDGRYKGVFNQRFNQTPK